jgi:hypothetical protein
MQMDLSDVHIEKVHLSMPCRFEIDSNWSSEREMQRRKQLSPRTVTVDGMQIDLSDEHQSKAR